MDDRSIDGLIDWLGESLWPLTGYTALGSPLFFHLLSLNFWQESEKKKWFRYCGLRVKSLIQYCALLVYIILSVDNRMLIDWFVRTPQLALRIAHFDKCKCALHTLSAAPGFPIRIWLPENLPLQIRFLLRQGNFSTKALFHSPSFAAEIPTKRIIYHCICDHLVFPTRFQPKKWPCILGARLALRRCSMTERVITRDWMRRCAAA